MWPWRSEHRIPNPTNHSTTKGIIEQSKIIAIHTLGKQSCEMINHLSMCIRTYLDVMVKRTRRIKIYHYMSFMGSFMSMRVCKTCGVKFKRLDVCWYHGMVDMYQEIIIDYGMYE